MKTLIIRSADTYVEIAERRDGRPFGKMPTAKQTMLARFTRGNLQAHMFFLALDGATHIGMPDHLEMDLNANDSDWIERGLKLRSPHTPIERMLAQACGINASEAAGTIIIDG